MHFIYSLSLPTALQSDRLRSVQAASGPFRAQPHRQRPVQEAEEGGRQQRYAVRQASQGHEATAEATQPHPEEGGQEEARPEEQEGPGQEVNSFLPLSGRGCFTITCGCVY